MFVGIASVNAQLTDGLVAHWPLDELNGDTTPDVVSGYNMTADNLTAGNVSKASTAMRFPFLMLKRHSCGARTRRVMNLPVNKHDSFTVSFWSKVDGNGQNDLRLFSESNTKGDNGPLFNIGTKTTVVTEALIFTSEGRGQRSAIFSPQPSRSMVSGTMLYLYRMSSSGAFMSMVSWMIWRLRPNLSRVGTI